ncbi:MAG: MFS transporter [Spirochaetota bacterium]
MKRWYPVAVYRLAAPKAHAWIAWALFLPTYFFAFFQRTVTSVIGVELAAVFSLSGTVTGLLSAMYFYIYAMMQIPNGILADTVGPRRMVVFGSVIMGAATIAFAFPVSLPYAMAMRFLIGFGASFNFIALLKLQTRLFSGASFAYVSGLTIFVGNLGALFGVGPFAAIAGNFGWQNAFIAFGVLILLFAVVLFFFGTDGPVPVREKRYRLADTMREIIADRRNFLTFIAFAFSNGPYIAFASLWGAPFFMHVYGMNALAASGFVVWLPIGVAAGCLTNGVMVKLFRTDRRAVISILTAAAVFWAVLAFVRIPPSYIMIYRPLLFLLGFCIASLNIIFTTIRSFTPSSMTGTAFAFTNMGGFIMISILQPLCGRILDASTTMHVTAHSAGIPIYPYKGYRIMLVFLLTLHVLAIISYWSVGMHTKKHSLP